MKISSRLPLGRSLLVVFSAFLVPGNIAFAAPATLLADAGRATMPVTTAATASPATKDLAGKLQEYLGRISGATFEAATGDGLHGIAVGTAADFPGLHLEGEFDPADPARREEYILRSHDGGVYLVGATQTAVSDAVWDFLYRLGYRQFFPGQHWEVVPHTAHLSTDVDIKEKPAFYARSLWYGFGDWPDGREDQENWRARNRMAGGLVINSGHSWDAIYKGNQKEFDAHPEYLVSKNPVKFCVSNPGLRKLVVDWAIQYFHDYPDRDSISLEPSDGDGWDGVDGNCPDAKVYNNVTDRVVTLANEVADAVTKQYPGKYVGIYAYFKHSPPPTIKVHTHVIVGVATAFIQGDYTFEQLAKAWAAQGATLGVRDYYSVALSHKDKPGGPNASDVPGTAEKIKKQYALGGRFLSAESSDSWGPAGLGYYTAARMMWNVHENPDEIREDFLAKAFGPAKEPMREFYDVIDGANRPIFTPDLLGRMYRQLDAARKLTDDPGIRARLDDLTLWTRYSELWLALSNSGADPKLSEVALRFAYRIHRTHMVSSLAIWRDTRGGYVKQPEEAAWNIPEGKNPWKETAPFTAEEIAGYIRDGIANNAIISFKRVRFSDNLKPAAALNLPQLPAGNVGFTRGEQGYYVWFDAPGTLKLDVTGGQIAANATSRLSLWDKDQAEAPPQEEGAPEIAPAPAIAEAAVPNDKTAHAVELKVPKAGLYRLVVKEGGRGNQLEWPAGTKVTVPSSDENRTLLRGKWSMYFYVPKGTARVGGYADGWGAIVDGSGTKVADIKPGYFDVPVPAGQDGKLWKFPDSTGRRILMTVPPYLARSAEELLLPEEVIKADGGR